MACLIKRLGDKVQSGFYSVIYSTKMAFLDDSLLRYIDDDEDDYEIAELDWEAMKSEGSVFRKHFVSIGFMTAFYSVYI